MISNTNPQSISVGVMQATVPSLIFDFGGVANKAQDNTQGKAAPGGDADKLELLRLQLSLNPS